MLQGRYSGQFRGTIQRAAPGPTYVNLLGYATYASLAWAEQSEQLNIPQLLRTEYQCILSQL
jgi:hypothetical protein